MTDAQPPIERTRLAPSPTGALHLGNARTFLINWALARQGGWRVLLRIEDLAAPRTKPGAAQACIEDLRWLGLDWDEGPVFQTESLEPYRAAMARLAGLGLVYPCSLTRREVESASSAPQEGDHEVRFPAALRPAEIKPRAFDDDESSNWRFVVEPGEVGFEDAVAGFQRCDPAGEIGDFVVWTRRGQPAYQLAVVVDDARQGVTRVVRGDDLLGSTARQLLLQRALGLGPEPGYVHLPLVRGEDGRRLAKRHGDTRLATYRAMGVPAERVAGLLAWWSGVVDRRVPIDARGFSEGFRLDRMPGADVVFTREDHRWLVDG